jgi:hypothetical protein
MGIITKANLPLAADAAKFSVPPAAAIAAGTGAYGTLSTAGASRWVLGSALKQGRKLLVTLQTGAIANAPTAIKVGLQGGGTNASGASGAEIAASVTEFATPAGNTTYQAEIDLALVTDLTKYYSLEIGVNGAGATSTVIAGASAEVLDPIYVP